MLERTLRIYVTEVYKECNFIFYQQGAGLQTKRYCLFIINIHMCKNVSNSK